MEVRLASVPAPGRPANEDQAFVTGGLVGVLDGVTAPVGVQTGCVHGPAWYARRLATRLAEAYGGLPEAPPTDLLAQAIGAVRGDHGGGCDLTNPGTPAATVCLLQAAGDEARYLVLADTTLVLDAGTGLDVVSDRRAELIGTGASTMDKHRYTNQPGGYWVAAAVPEAAYEALTGSVPLCGPAAVRRAALLTDGAARAVDVFALLDWAGLLDLLAAAGPAELIRQVRAAESAARSAADDPVPPGHKRHDDASAALCLFAGDGG
jgi:hypothetical protein